MKSATLQTTGLFGKTFRLTTILLILLGGITEWVARSEFFQARLTPPKMGSRRYQLGYKLALLEEVKKKNGFIDCIMVGSSMVDVGFDPNAFNTGYEGVTGRDIRCFNFGIDASSAISTAALARILIEDYDPAILIFGTDPRDYAVLREDQDTAVVLDSPWVKYRQGHFSLEGWLLDTSYLYRYRQHFSRLVRFNFEDTLWSETNLDFEILNNGFTPIRKVSTYINYPPNPQDDSFEVRYYTRIYSSYKLLNENLAASERIMAYKRSGTQVIVVEMPVSDGLYYFFGNGQADYDLFITRLVRLADQYQAPFLRSEPLDMIPDNGWADYSHLNTNGAERFSVWLGQQVGKLAGHR